MSARDRPAARETITPQVLALGVGSIAGLAMALIPTQAGTRGRVTPT